MSAIKHDQRIELRQYFEQIKLEEYYSIIVEELKVFTFDELATINDSDLIARGMSKSQVRKLKRHVSSSTMNHSTNFTSTLGKLLVRKLTLRSNSNLTRSTCDLNHHQYPRPTSSITSLDQSIHMGKTSQQQKNIISPQNIQLIEQIGEGEFGTVFKAFWKTKQNDLLTVAVKRLNKLDQDFVVDDILKEVGVLQDIEHTHIVQFFGIVIQTDGSFMLVTEYAHSRSLYECLIASNGKIEYPIEILIEFLKQIAQAMSYLEKKFLIHRDLASRNILVFNKSLVKLSDFGLSRLCCSETNYYKTSWKDTLRLPIAWMSPEAISYLRFTSSSDVFSFGVCMWECFSYGEMPWQGMSSAEIVNAIDAPNHQRLPRPGYATVELYQIMLNCWKAEPAERPTFVQLEKQLSEIELKKVRWKDKTVKTMPEGFLPVESCLLGPLTIVDRCLNVPTINNIIQCIALDGQIGFVSNTDVEPLHIVSITKPVVNSSNMSHFFQRKPENKKNLLKNKGRQLSKDMIGLPQADFIHAFHIGVSGETFGDVTCLSGVEKSELLKISIEKSSSISNDKESSDDEISSNYQNPIERENDSSALNDQPGSSLLDEVLQAFTEIYLEPESIQNSSPIKAPPKPERSAPTSPKTSPMVETNSFVIAPVTIDILSTSSEALIKSIDHSPEETSPFTRELEQRLHNSEISEEAKNAYDHLINGCSKEDRSHCTSHADLSSTTERKISLSADHRHPPTVLFGSSSSSSSTSISTSSISNPTSSSSSSNRVKSDRHSHYSSTSTDNDISMDLKSIHDQSPLKLLRNGYHLTKMSRQQSHESPLSSNSNTLSNLSSNSPVLSNVVPSSSDSQSFSSSNSISTQKHEANSLTGQPLPPPPDLSSLGSKLTTATMTHTLKIPAPLTGTNTYRSKKRFNLFT